MQLKKSAKYFHFLADLLCDLPQRALGLAVFSAARLGAGSLALGVGFDLSCTEHWQRIRRWEVRLAGNSFLFPHRGVVVGQSSCTATPLGSFPGLFSPCESSGLDIVQVRCFTHPPGFCSPANTPSLSSVPAPVVSGLPQD